MTEYIITDKQLKTATEAYLEHELLRPITEVFISGDKLPKIVRCRDCVHYKPYRTHQHGMMNRCHDEHGHTHKRDDSDFCSRGERRTNDN